MRRSIRSRFAAEQIARWQGPAEVLETRQLLSTSIASGQTISASITRLGEIDAYTFSAQAGSTFEVSVGDPNSSSGYHSDFVIYGPAGLEATSAATYATGSSARSTYTVPGGGGGTYTIDVQDATTAGTGAYSLELITAPAAQASDSDGDGGAIASGQNKSGTINRPGDIDAYTFSASAGDSFTVSVGDANSASTFNPQVLVYAGDGSLVGNSYNFNTNSTVQVSSTVASGKAGTFTVVVQDAYTTNTGAYVVGLTQTTHAGTPSIAVSAPASQSATAGVGKSFSLGSLTEANATSPYTVDVSWGDNSADTAFTASSPGTITAQSHTYTTTGAETVHLFVRDANGNLSNTASFVVTVSSASTGGGAVSGAVSGGVAGETIYLDANNNSALDSGEPSTTTSASGAYSLVNVPAGAYIIRQVLPGGYTQISPANGYGIHVSVSGGGSLSGENFTDKGPSTSGGSISGTVAGGKAGETIYLDANNNSTLDAGERSTTTSSSGAYSFSGVPAGAYIIRQVLPGGYKQSTPASGYGIHVTVSNGSSLSGQNFTDATTTGNTASITGTVFSDANSNGKQDSGETGLSGWTLYIDLTNAGSYLSGDPTATTDSSGNYIFSGLAAGNYIVRAQRPSGYSQTLPTNNLGQHITLAAGQKSTGVLFGEKKIS